MALPSSIELHIVTPDREVVREQVDEVEIPGALGYFGVLPGHTPMLAELAVGELWYRKGTEKVYLAMAFGFAEVLPDRVTVLAQLAERAEEIDPARAEEAKKRAEVRLLQAKDVDYDRARAALTKSLARLQVVSRAQLAGRVGHRHLEINILRKSLYEAPADGEGGPAGKHRAHLAMIKLGEYTDGANDMPVLFDQSCAAWPQPVGDIFNEAPVQHARSS